MKSFVWRGRTVKVDDRVIYFDAENPIDTRLSLPARIVSAYAMDGNVIVCLLENGQLWQCGGVRMERLVPAAAAGEELRNIGPEQYADAAKHLDDFFKRA